MEKNAEFNFIKMKKKIASISYERMYPEEVDFLLRNISKINECVKIEYL